MASNRQKHPGVEVRGESIRICFMYRGARCKETIKGLKVSRENLKFASTKRSVILHEIAIGTFDYAKHFPESSKAQIFSGSKAIKRTVAEAVDLWLSAKKGNVAKSTIDNYVSKANKHIVPQFGYKPISMVLKTEIEQWISVSLSHLKNKTINEILIIMRGIFRDAMADRIISENPMGYIDNGEVIKDPPDPFTQTEINKILATKTRRRAEVLMMKFAIWTGVRVSELIAFGWDDIDFDRGIIKVSRANVKGHYKIPKTKGSVREIELLKPALDALIEIKTDSFAYPPIEITITREDNKTLQIERWRPIWRNSNTKQPHANDGTVRERFWSNHLIKAGVRYRGPNHARHTYASQLLSTGAISKDWIASQMGHVNTKMLDERYAKWIPEDAPPMASIVNQVFGFEKKGKGQNVPHMSQNKKAGF